MRKLALLPATLLLLTPMLITSPSAQATEAKNPNITIPLPTITAPLPSIGVPLPTITVPLPTLSLPIPLPTTSSSAPSSSSTPSSAPSSTSSSPSAPGVGISVGVSASLPVIEPPASSSSAPSTGSSSPSSSPSSTPSTSSNSGLPPILPIVLPTLSLTSNVSSETNTNGQITQGSTLTLQANLSNILGVLPVASGQLIHFSQVNADGTLSEIGTALTDAAGNATYSFIPTASGIYQASFGGVIGLLDSALSGKITTTYKADTILTAHVPTNITLGASGSITGQLTTKTGGNAQGDQTVSLLISTDNSHFSVVTSAKTDIQGKVSFTVTPNGSAYYMLKHDANVLETGLASASPSYLSKVSAMAAVNIKANTTTVKVGKTAVISGSLILKDSKGIVHALSGQTVQLWSSTAGKTWVKRADVKTNTQGLLSYTIAQNNNVAYQWRFFGGNTYQGVTVFTNASYSGLVKIAVPFAISTPHIAKVVNHAAISSVTGIVAPGVGNTIQLVVDNKIVTSAKTNTHGAYTLRYTFKKGTHKAYVRIPATLYNTATTSMGVTVKSI